MRPSATGRRRKFRSRAVAIVFVVLLAAVVNVGVSWALARSSTLRTAGGWSSRTESDPLISAWPGPVPTNWPTAPSETTTDAPFEQRVGGLQREHQWGPGWSLTAIKFIQGGHKKSYGVWSFGFPFPCLSRDYLTSMSLSPFGGSTIVAGDGFRGGWEPAGNPAAMAPYFRVHSDRALPLVPRPLAFAGNTVIYAAVLAVPLVLVPRLRRRARARRGECVRCRYPVGSSTVCSECGTEVADRPLLHAA